MNDHIIPTLKQILVKENDEILRAEELSLSEELKTYVKKSQELFPQQGEKKIVFCEKKSHDREAYTLDISKDGVVIEASAPQGAYYALVTLSQLFELNDQVLPALRVSDSPSMKLRGISDDVARGQISTLENFKDIIRRLSYVKCNLYMPYLEDSFAFQSYPDSGKFSDPVGAEEWRELVAYAKDYYITIIPVFNTIGHWDKNAKLEYFHELVMKENDEKDGLPCSSVDVRNPEARQMIFNMLDELLEVFGEAGAIHVGGDEVGDYTRLFQKEKAGEYYNAHFNRIYDYLKQKGIQTFLYSDMYTPLYGDYALGIEYIDQMPDDMNFVFWDYACRADYPNIRHLTERNKTFYLSPATFTWGRMLPQHTICWENTRRLALHGKEAAKGVIMSAWCDGGMTLREENWFGIYVGALYAWNTETDLRFDEMVKSYFRLFFGIDVDLEQYHRLMDYDRNFVEQPYREDSGEKIEFWYDRWQGAGAWLFREFWKDATLPADKELQEKLAGCEKLFKDGYAYFSKQNATKNRCAYEAFLFDIYRSAVAVRKIEMLSDKPYASREEAMRVIPKIDKMTEELQELLVENKKQWFASNRQSEWNYVEAKYLDLIDSFAALKRYCLYGKNLGRVKRL